ncbi:MAG: tyrosine--tRNA ligase [Patescibacteria group bacterium]
MKEIKQFLSRGIENIFPSKESFAQMLESDKKLLIYLGLDPTGPTLHMGHAIPLMKLAELQKMGHRVILLMGDFTAMIGDPSDKLAVRKQLSHKEVLSNLKLYKKQASIFLSFSGRNKAEIKYNSKWLSKMNFADVLNLASKMTVDQMLKRDMFRKRAEEGKPTFIHEFLYPLMQGYDSVAMDVDAEIGGNDQTFNMLTGRDLMKTMKNKDKFVIATKLLTDSSGVKMGKTESNMITFTDSAQDMFGKVMSWPDDIIIRGFELCTDVADEIIAKEKEFLAGSGNPRDAKLRLAEAIVSIYHGLQVAKSSHDSFLSAYSLGAMPADVPEIKVSLGMFLADVLLEQKIVSSKTDFKRLISEGAIRNLKNGETLKISAQKADVDMDLKIGKHRFIKIRIK